MIQYVTYVADRYPEGPFPPSLSAPPLETHLQTECTITSVYDNPSFPDYDTIAWRIFFETGNISLNLNNIQVGAGAPHAAALCARRRQRAAALVSRHSHAGASAAAKCMGW